MQKIIKQKKVKIKDKFNFGIKKYKFNMGRLYLRKSFSNIFLTFTDLSNKVIICKTSGNSGITGSKRRKRIPLALETIVKSLHRFFLLYQIKSIQIVLKMRKNSYFKTLLKLLSYYGISISGFSYRRILAFNGVKGRKLRRL